MQQTHPCVPGVRLQKTESGGVRGGSSRTGAGAGGAPSGPRIPTALLLAELGTWESCLINAAALLGGLLSPLHRRAN